MIADGTISFKDMMVVIMSIMLAVSGVSEAAARGGDRAKSIAATKRIKKILFHKSEIDPFNSEGKEIDSEGQIIFKDVSFYYPSRPEVMILQDIDFKIESGQKVAFVGPSGGGKSTIMAMLLRYYNQSNGQISHFNLHPFSSKCAKLMPPRRQ